MKNFLIIIIYIFFGTVYTQVSTFSNPKSSTYQMLKSPPIFKTGDIDINQLEQEDFIDQQNGKPFRFGYSFNVNINFFDEAICDTLSNGDKIFRLQIDSKDAYSINFIFNEFILLDGAELFIYNIGQTDLIGAFTSQNNKEYNRFSTTPILGDQVIIEYYAPYYLKDYSSINISNIINGYKDVFNHQNRGYDDSESCNNNVNCPEAQPWNDEVSSVVLTLTDGGTRLCSGAMINNVNQDFELYFLTSETCLGGHEDWIFMFNYESPTCESQDGIIDQTVSGATLLAHNSESDFALLRLEESPPEDFDIYFSGWDARLLTPSDCISIHHPVGDIKKISYHTGDAISDGWYFDDDSHWRIDSWNSGITEPGSYGAPLFNSNNRIVGQLHGGESSCEEAVDDYYGKFSNSWALGLKEWLDPDDTGTMVIDGIGVIESPDPMLSYSNDMYDILIVNDEIEIFNLLVSNIGDEESILDYQIYNSPFSTASNTADSANYYWTDSDQSNHHDYYWLDINDSGSQVWFEDNDQAAGPFNIGFEFPFYNNLYSNFIISPNGWIGFESDNPEWENTAIPSTEAPSPAIFAFWDDLNPVNLESSPDMSGEVKYYSDGNRLVISYVDITHWGDDAPYTFQIIIHKNGLIHINYAGMMGERTSATIGIQNETGEVGQQVIYNDDYVHNFLGLALQQAPKWFLIDGQNTISNQLDYQESVNHILEVDGSQIENGNYSTYLHIESNATGPITIPILVQIGYQAEIGDVNYDGTINVQDVVLLVSMILNGYPPNLEADINQDGQINVLDTVLLIELILN